MGEVGGVMKRISVTSSGHRSSTAPAPTAASAARRMRTRAAKCRSLDLLVQGYEGFGVKSWKVLALGVKLRLVQDYRV